MKTFNTTGVCIPERHYMVDLTSRLSAIRRMIDAGEYFTINRARQYGKTTTLRQLRLALQPDYSVVSLDFQRISNAAFETEGNFVHAFARLLMDGHEYGTIRIPEAAREDLSAIAGDDRCATKLDQLFRILTRWCGQSDRPVVLMIDEVDSATNNQVFLDFLAQLRGGYIDRADVPAFQSVILAGVTDVKNLKRKLRPDEASRFNSPWNIAADFNVDMSFSAADIAGMLGQYEADHHTGMDIAGASRLIRDYTSGYPFLVCRICKLLDAEPVLGWDAHGVGEAVRRILAERNTLFESLMGKVQENEGLRRRLRCILFAGESVTYDPYDIAIADAEMYGFVRNDGGTVQIANRIFETLLYNCFLGQAEQDERGYRHGAAQKSSFIIDGRLDMERVLERYVAAFNNLYGDFPEPFSEAEGRLRFLLFVRPIINGTGNYYIEAETRNNERMDLVVDYLGERFVVELKIWRGDAYNRRGERQLAQYLEHFHLKKGYMLSYSFNKGKQPGVKHIRLGDKLLVEAVV